MRISFIKQKQTAPKKNNSGGFVVKQKAKPEPRERARARLETFSERRARKSSLSKTRPQGLFAVQRGFELLITMMEKWADCFNRK
jgi:hypothetical protein